MEIFLIMKNILNKVYFHPLFIVSVLLFIFMGKFRFICYFMILIIVHESGHILTSLLFKWKIDKVIILPFGGLTKYNIKINTPLFQQFIVSISGIIFQILFYLLIANKINYDYLKVINSFIIGFNILPIYPLDGSKLLNVILNIITSFKNSLLISVIISYILIILITYYFFSINKIIFLIMSFLILEVNKLYKERNLIFNKFLLERHLNSFKFKREKVINNINKMKKDYRHIFYFNNRYVTEKYYLNIYFNKN